MKINRFILNLVVHLAVKGDKKRYSSFKLDDKYTLKKDIFYLNDNNLKHSFDLIIAPKENRRNICIIDIHGGAYIFGKKTNNYTFGSYFLEKGFDFITVEYQVNNGNRSALDMIKECASALNYIAAHQKELGLENEEFVLTGDSAGGHLALTLAEMYSNSKYSVKVINSPIKLKLNAVLLNCPTFDYVNLGRKDLSKSGLKRMLGKDYNDLLTRTLIDPNSHLSNLNIPLFVSTCTNDFIRGQSLKLNEAMKNTKLKYQFIDLDEKDKNINHVHNVTMPHLEQSKYINDSMIKFIEEALAK